MINITFPDNSVKQFEDGITPLQIAQSLSPQLARDVLAASVNEQEWDLTRPIDSDATIKLFKWDDPEGKHAFWHSSAHLLAEALQELFPGVKFGIWKMAFIMTSTPTGIPLLLPIFLPLRAKCSNLQNATSRLCGRIFPKPML